MPKPSKEDIASPKDYKHCIDLTQRGYIIIIDGQKHVALNEQKLSSFLKVNRPNIIKQPISIISDSATSYEKIVNTLDLMTELRIDKYKLVSVNGKFPPDSPIVVPTTRSSIKDNDFDDSTVLIISISNDEYETSLLDKKVIQKKVSELETFLSNNKANINPDKIVVTGPDNVPYKILKPVLSLLNKYGYYHYRIITKD